MGWHSYPGWGNKLRIVNVCVNTLHSLLRINESLLLLITWETHWCILVLIQIGYKSKNRLDDPCVNYHSSIHYFNCGFEFHCSSLGFYSYVGKIPVFLKSFQSVKAVFSLSATYSCETWMNRGFFFFFGGGSEKHYYKYHSHWLALMSLLTMPYPYELWPTSAVLREWGQFNTTYWNISDCTGL